MLYTEMTAGPKIEDKYSSISIPQLKERIVEWITSYFKLRNKEVVTQDDIYKIADKTIKKYQMLRAESSTFSPVKQADISIKAYDDEFILVNTERYPTEYNFITFKVVCSTIDFWVTVIEHTNEIKLAYVSR